MPLTDLQTQAISLFHSGKCVSAQAVPGAGKTHMLVHACQTVHNRYLILSYNVQLKNDTCRALEDAETDAICITFHALCTRCIAPARDDISLLTAVERVEQGVLEVHDLPDVTHILIDEAQDVRPLYTRLLKVLGLVPPNVTMFVVGDHMQLIYDFDEDFPASLSTLKHPMEVFSAGNWTHIELSNTHRLTHQMAHMVQILFGVNVQAQKSGPKVVVEEAVDANEIFSKVGPLLTRSNKDKRTMLLVHKKKGNRILRGLLNKLVAQVGNFISWCRLRRSFVSRG